MEVDRGGGYLFARGSLEAVCEVSAAGQVEAHDAVVWVEECGVDGEICGRAGVGLDVDSPFGGGEVVEVEGAGYAEGFDLVNVFVSAVVSFADFVVCCLLMFVLINTRWCRTVGVN